MSKFKTGDLVQLSERHREFPRPALGLIIDVIYPFKDDPTWADCQIFWSDTGLITSEWSGDLVSLGKEET